MFMRFLMPRERARNEETRLLIWNNTGPTNPRFLFGRESTWNLALRSGLPSFSALHETMARDLESKLEFAVY